MIIARGEVGQRGFTQGRFGRTLQASPLEQQPGLKCWTRREIHALKKISPDAWHRRRLAPGAHAKRVDIDVRRGRQHQAALSTGQDIGYSEESPQLRKAPAQRTERIVGIAEQQLREVFAANRVSTGQQVRQYGPGLAPSWWRSPDAVDLDAAGT